MLTHLLLDPGRSLREHHYSEAMLSATKRTVSTRYNCKIFEADITGSLAPLTTLNPNVTASGPSLGTGFDAFTRWVCLPLITRVTHGGSPLGGNTYAVPSLL